MSTSIASRLLFAFILSLLCCSQLSAKGGNMANQDPYKTQYVARTLETFDFAALAEELKAFRAPAIMCIERIPQACHRSLVAPKLQAALKAREVVHLQPSAAAFEAQRALRDVKRNRARTKRKYG